MQDLPGPSVLTEALTTRSPKERPPFRGTDKTDYIVSNALAGNLVGTMRWKATEVTEKVDRRVIASSRQGITRAQP